MNDWDLIRNYLQRKVSADSFDNWLKGTACVGQEGDTLYVSVPDRETRSWLEKEYSTLIAAGIQELGLSLRRVSYETAGPRPPQPMAPPPVTNGYSDTEASSSALNPKFTCATPFAAETFCCAVMVGGRAMPTAGAESP